MRAPDSKLIDRLAAEYVLGTLRGPARRRFERWLSSAATGGTTQASARQAVARWEDYLVHLIDDRDRVDPSPQVWREIERRTRAPASKAVRWQPWALAASVLIVAFGAWFALDSRRAQPDWQVAAELRPEAAGGLQWRVDYDSKSAALRITAVAPPAIGADAVHELWALADDASPPVSLGLLPQSGDLLRTLAPAQRTAFLRAGKIAVSREPAGGSPTGVPTGPVLIVVPRGAIVSG